MLKRDPDFWICAACNRKLPRSVGQCHHEPVVEEPKAVEPVVVPVVEPEKPKSKPKKKAAKKVKEESDGLN